MRTSIRSEETSYLLGVNRLCDHQYRVSLVCLHLRNNLTQLGADDYEIYDWVYELIRVSTRLRCSPESPYLVAGSPTSWTRD